MYPETVACEESASIDCARVVRGIDSIANATTPCSRRRAIPSASVSGSRKPTTTVPFASLGDELSEGDATHATASASVGSDVASTSSAPAVEVLVVRESCGFTGSSLDAKLEAGVAELRDRFGNERHAALVRSRLPRDRDTHAVANLRRGGEGGALYRHNEAHTSIFVRVRRMTSSVKSEVP